MTLVIGGVVHRSLLRSAHCIYIHIHLITKVYLLQLLVLEELLLYVLLLLEIESASFQSLVKTVHTVVP